MQKIHWIGLYIFVLGMCCNSYADTTGVSGDIVTSSLTVTGAVSISSLTATGNLSAQSVTANSITVSGPVFASTLTVGGIVGVTNGSNAATGNIGEFMESIVSNNTPVTISPNNTFVNITSIVLSSGDWDVSGMVGFHTTGSVLASDGALSAYSGNTTTDQVYGDNATENTGPTNPGVLQVISIPSWRVSTSATKTIYLKGYADSTSGTATTWGRISARRVR